MIGQSSASAASMSAQVCSCPLCAEPDLPFSDEANQLALPLPAEPEPLVSPRQHRRLADIVAEATRKVYAS